MIALLAACAEDPCEIPPDALGAPTERDLAALAAGLPPSPDPGFLAMEDGLALAVRDQVPPAWDGQAIVLFVPGSSAHSAEYSAIGAGLAARGVYARLVDVRGHGLSACRAADDCEDPSFTEREPVDDSRYFVGRLGDSADADQIVRDLGHVVADLRAAFPAATLVVGGHSSGGGVVSRWVEGGGAAAADGFALVAPYNHPDQPQVRPEAELDCADLAGTGYARLDLGALGDALRGDVHRYVLTLHKPAEYTEPLDVSAYTWTTTQGMAARSVDGFWPAFTAPLLVVAATDDALLDPELTAREAERAPDVTFVEVGDTSHVGLAWSDEVAGLLADFARR